MRKEAMEVVISQCNMKEPEHIEQMIQTAADRKKPRITGTDITTRETNDRMARQRPKTAQVTETVAASQAPHFTGWYENCRKKLKPENFAAIEQAKKRRAFLLLQKCGPQLCEYAASGNLPQIKNFFKTYNTLQYADYDKRTPLHIAAAKGHLEIVQFMV